MLAKPTVFRFRRWLPGQVCRGAKSQANPVFVSIFDDQSPQCLINIGQKAHALGVDQIVDHERPFSFTPRYRYKKKACFHRLSWWSECTDLNRGPLVPQSRVRWFARCFRVTLSCSWSDTYDSFLLPSEALEVPEWMPHLIKNLIKSLIKRTELCRFPRLPVCPPRALYERRCQLSW